MKRSKDNNGSSAKRRLPLKKASENGPAHKNSKSDPWGCMAGTITVAPGVDLTEPTGEIWNAELGKLHE